MHYKLISIVALALASAGVNGADSSEDIYNACADVFDVMIDSAKKTFGDGNLDSDKIMTSFLCPLTRTMSKSIEEGVKSTLDGESSSSFEDSQDEVRKKGKKYNTVLGDNKYVCPSMNSLLKNLKHIRAVEKTDMKATYTTLGNGIIDTSSACIDNKKVKDVVCPIVKDLVSAVKMFGNIVDDSANGQKMVSKIADKGEELLKSVDCDDNKELKKEIGNCVSSAGLTSTTRDTLSTSTDNNKNGGGGGGAATSSCTTSTTSSPQSNPTTWGAQPKATGPTKGTGAGNGGGYTPTQGGWGSPKPTSGCTTTTSSTTPKAKTTSSEDCDCEKDDDKKTKSGKDDGNVVTTTDSDGHVYTTAPFYAQGDAGSNSAPFAAAVFAAVLMPLL